VNKKQDARGSTPTNEDEVPRTNNPRPSIPWPPPRPQSDDIQAHLGIPTEEIQPRAPESQQVYLNAIRSQANSLSARFRGSTQEVRGVIGRSIERVGDLIYRYEIFTCSSMLLAFPGVLLTVTRDRGNNSSYPGWAGDNAIAPQEQQRWPGTQSSVSNAPTWPGQQNWSAFQFQFSAPEYKPAPQEHQGMPGPHPNLSSIQNQPANHYSAVPQKRPVDEERRRFPRPLSLLSTAQNQPVNQNSGLPHFQSTVPQKRPADQERRRLPRPHPYLPTVQNQPVNHNSRIPHSQSAVPQKRLADEERRRLPRPRSLLSNVPNQPGHQNPAVRHLQSAIPQKRPPDQEERRVQGTRSLLPTAPMPPRKPISKTSLDPFSGSEDPPELLEPSMRESREQNVTPNTIPKRMVETAPYGERKLSLDRPKLGPRPVGYKPAHAPQGRSTARSLSPMAEPPSESPRMSNHENRQERVSGVFGPVDRNHTATKRPAANVDDTGGKPLGASDNEFGLPRT